MKWRSVRIPDREYHLLKEIAEEEKKPISTTIAHLVDHYIACEKESKVEEILSEALGYTEKARSLLEVWRRQKW